MAWRCSALTNEGLIAALQKEKLIKTPAVAAAMRQIDRKWFVPSSQRAHAYEDRPLPIGHGATISAPHMHAIMLQLICPFIMDYEKNNTNNSNHDKSISTNDVNTTQKLQILDVGSGSGYLTAVLASLCDSTLGHAKTAQESKWHVCGIEHIADLHRSALSAMQTCCRPWIESGEVKMVCGDGRDPATTLHLSDANAQFNIIHVGAAAPANMQSTMQKLLRPNGCLVIPVGEENGTQELLVCHRDKTGQIHCSVNCHVVFVPLTTVDHQQRDRDEPPTSRVYAPQGDTFYLSGALTNKTGVLIVGDIFGLMKQSKRFPDMIAQEGYLIIMPDFFEELAWPHDEWPPNFESAKWKHFYQLAHNIDHHRVRAKKAIEVLRQMGCTKVGVFGVCWGALVSFDLAAKGLVDACVTSHPSFFDAKYVQAAKVPVCVLPSVDEGNCDAIEAAVKNHPYQPSVFHQYHHLHHGFFGARMDPEKLDDVARAELDDAVVKTFSFLNATLK